MQPHASNISVRLWLFLLLATQPVGVEKKEREEINVYLFLGLEIDMECHKWGIVNNIYIYIYICVCMYTFTSTMRDKLSSGGLWFNVSALWIAGRRKPNFVFIIKDLVLKHILAQGSCDTIQKLISVASSVLSLIPQQSH